MYYIILYYLFLTNFVFHIKNLCKLQKCYFYNLIKDFINKHTQKNGSISKKFIFGNSSGGRMSIIMTAAYPEFFDAVIPMGASEIPDEKLLDLYDKHNISLFFAMGKRDEFNYYQKEIVPLLPRMQTMKNSYVFTPEWVYNGDKGLLPLILV